MPGRLKTVISGSMQRRRQVRAVSQTPPVLRKFAELVAGLDSWQNPSQKSESLLSFHC